MERRQQQKAATAQRIYAAAAELFVSQGYANTTVEQICGAAGVAKGTFFVHFSSKAAVLDYIGRLQMARLAEQIAATPAFPALPFREQLRQLFHTFARTLDGQKELVLITGTELLSRRGATIGGLASVDELDLLLANLARAAQANGQLRPGLDPARIAQALRNTYFAALFDWVQTADQPITVAIDAAVDLLFTGIAAS